MIVIIPSLFLCALGIYDSSFWLLVLDSHSEVVVICFIFAWTGNLIRFNGFNLHLDITISTLRFDSGFDWWFIDFKSLRHPELRHENFGLDILR